MSSFAFESRQEREKNTHIWLVSPTWRIMQKNYLPTVCKLLCCRRVSYSFVLNKFPLSQNKTKKKIKKEKQKRENISFWTGNHERYGQIHSNWSTYLFANCDLFVVRNLPTGPSRSYDHCARLTLVVCSNDSGAQ